MFFREHSWRGFRWDTFKNGRRYVSYRVDQVQEFRKGWRGGFSDILLMNSCRAGFNYCAKYLLKAVSLRDAEQSSGGANKETKHVKTLALSWFFRKRSFAISGGLAQLYSDLIKQLNSNSNLTCDVVIGFSGEVVFCGVVEWSLHGFVRGFVDGWGDHWQKVARDELLELENLGRFEKK
jgi:hypothetical protein